MLNLFEISQILVLRFSQSFCNLSSLFRKSVMNPKRCAACRYLRRRCPKDCVFSPYFPPNNPEKFACVHRIYGAGNVSKMLQVYKIFFFVLSFLNPKLRQRYCISGLYITVWILMVIFFFTATSCSDKSWSSGIFMLWSNM